jgi:hypothetical protein
MKDNALGKMTKLVENIISANIKNIKTHMSSISINGTVYQGNSIVVTGNKVVINGQDVTPDAKVINITVDGDVDSVSAEYCQKIIVNGNAKTVTSQSGDIECKDVTGNVKTMSGDVKCGTVAGSVRSTTGDIKNAK